MELNQLLYDVLKLTAMMSERQVRGPTVIKHGGD